VERVQHRSRYERRLIIDPQFLNRLVGIRNDDSLVPHPKRQIRS
jgi:hypothetical protein